MKGPRVGLKQQELPDRTDEINQVIENTALDTRKSGKEEKKGSDDTELNFPWEAFEQSEKPSINKSSSINTRGQSLLKHLREAHNMSERAVLTEINSQCLLLLEVLVKQAEELGMSPKIDIEKAVMLKKNE